MMGKIIYSVTKPLAYLTMQVSSDQVNLFLKQFQQENKVMLSLGDVIGWVISQELKNYPEFNSYFEEDVKLYLEVNFGYFINVGKGVKLGVIKNADTLSLLDFSKEIKLLALRYIRGELTDTEAAQSTFAMTNLLPFGVHIAHSPIIEHHCVMFALGSEFELEGKKKFNFTLSFDARVADCQRALVFLKAIQERLEKSNF